MSDKKFLLGIFFSWRVLLFLPLLIASIFIPYRPDNEFTNILSKLSFQSPVANFLIFPWANFDGVHYLAIAKDGYIDQGRFFPLLPIIIKSLNFFGSSMEAYFWTGFIFIQICAVASLIAFYKLIRIDYSISITRKVVLALLLFPTSFFLVSVYTEAIFLLGVFLSFYLARKDRWFLSCLCILVVTLSRPVGFLIIPAILFEFWRSGGFLKAKNWLYFLLTPLGVGIYSYYCSVKWGDPLYYLHAQGALTNNRSVDTIILFPQTVFRYIKILVTTRLSNYESWVALIELAFFLVVLGLLILAYKKKIRTSYLIFAGLNFFVATATGTFSGLPRYCFVLFPIFIVIGMVENKWLRYGYYVVGGVLLSIFLMLFSRGYYLS